MRYVQWVQKVLTAIEECENTRTRLVGIPAAALRHPLDIDPGGVDAIEDAVYDLEVLGLVRPRPDSFFNLTPLGRQAAAWSIEDVCGNTIRETCRTLTDDQRSFVRVLMDVSETESDLFARMRYVDVERIFEPIGFRGSHEEEEAFLVPLVERKCIEYREFKSDRDARPLFTGAVCVPSEAAT